MKLGKIFWKRLAVIFVAIVALATGGLLNVYYTTILSTGTPGGTGQGGQSGNGALVLVSSYTDSQLVQKILDSMVNGADVQAVYESIPLYQLNGITYEEYFQYVGLLKRFMDSQADTYETMTISEREAVQKRIVSHSNEYKQVAYTSSYFWLKNAAASGETERLPLLIQKNIQGEPYLSRDWVTRSINIYDYSNLYFSVLENGNVDELAQFVWSDIEELSVHKLKAEKLIQYYQKSGFDFDTSMSVTSIRMDEIAFEQRFDVISGGDTEGMDYSQRTISIISPEKDVFEILDEVPMSLEKTDQVIYSGDNELFTIGEYVYSDQLTELIGPPDQVIRHRLPDWIEYPDDSEAMLVDVQYANLTLQVIGYSPADDDRWEGVVRTASLLRPGVRTGSGIEIGSETSELLLRYPFMDQHGYSIYDNLVELYAGRKDGRLVSVIITDHSYNLRYQAKERR